MSFSLWSSLVMLCCLGAISPGPSLAVVLRHTISYSPRHGAMVAISHSIGVGLWATVTLLGLSTLVHQSSLAFLLLSVGGGLYLGYLGVKSLWGGDQRDRLEGEPQGEPQGKPKGKTQVALSRSARDGFFISMMNPKLALFFLALFSQLIHPEMSGWERAVVIITVIVIDGGWYLLVAGGLSRSGVLDWLRAKLVWVDRITGVILLSFAVRIIWSIM